MTFENLIFGCPFCFNVSEFDSADGSYLIEGTPLDRTYRGDVVCSHCGSKFLVELRLRSGYICDDAREVFGE